METKSKGTISLIIMTLAIGLGLGVFQITRGIKQPFSDAVDSDETQTDDRAELIVLQGKDSDRDGLNDFDELYAFQTSPYLPDSDSDGTPDANELDNGTDPNCPEGVICRVEATNTNLDTGLTNLFNINTPEAQNLNAAINGNGNTNTTVLNPAIDQVSTEELRAALKSSGAPAGTIDNLDDATLRELYAEALTQEQASANTNVSGNTNSAINQPQGNLNASLPTNIDDLKNLSADEIRQLLISTGVPSDTLAGIDDALLQDIFLQAIQDELEGNTNTE